MDLDKSNVSRDDIEGRWRERSPERSPARSPSSGREKFSERGSEPRRNRTEDQGSEQVSFEGSPPRLGKQVRSAVSTVDPAAQKSPPSLGAPEVEPYRETKKEFRDDDRPYKQERDVKQAGRFYEDPPPYDNNQFSGDREPASREPTASRRRGDRYADNYKAGHDNYEQDRATKR